MVTRGRTSAQAFAGRRGRRPLRFAREWAAAGACPSSGPAGPPSPKGEGKGCSGGIHPSRGVGGRFRGAAGTPPPTVCPGMGGRGSLPLIRPYGATFPQGGRQGLLLAAAQGFAERRGRRPLRFAREWAAAGACPSSGPAGPPSPKGEGKGCSGGIHPSRGVGGGGRPRRGGGTRPTDGDMETLWDLRGHPFPGRRAVGAGHARPGGLRRPPSMVRSVGRGLDPSAGRRGRRPLRVAREWAVTGACPSSGPAGPPSPEGEGKSCCWRRRKPAPTPAAGPRCGAGGSGCSTSGLTKLALYRRNSGRCRGGSRR